MTAFGDYFPALRFPDERGDFFEVRIVKEMVRVLRESGLCLGLSQS
jgi:hypothetical protein